MPVRLPFSEVNALIRNGQAEKALSILEPALDDADLDIGERIKALDVYGKCCFALGRVPDGLRAFCSNCEMMRRLYSDNKLTADAMIAALHNYAHALTASGELEGARKIANEACEKALEAYGSGSSEYADALFRAAEPSYGAKDFQGAKALLMRAAAIWSQNQGTHESFGTCLNNLGRVCEELDDIEAGLMWHRKAVEYRRKLPDRMDLAFSLGNYGLALATGGEIGSAIEALRECVSVYGEIGAKDSKECLGFRHNLLILEQAMENRS